MWLSRTYLWAAQFPTGLGLGERIATVAYAGVFTWLGLRVKRALVWGLAYILIWEGFVARAGATPSNLSVRASTRSVLGRISEAPRDFVEVGAVAAVVVPLTAAALALALTVTTDPTEIARIFATY